MTWRTCNALCRRVGGIVAATLAAVAGAACQGPPTLAPGHAVEGRLEPDEAAVYRVDGGAREYVRLAVEPSTADLPQGLDARVVDPSGRTLVEANDIRDSPGGILAWVSAGAGEHLLEIGNSLSPEAIDYRANVLEQRPARPDDDDLAAAENARAEAVRAFASGDREAVRVALERELGHRRRVAGSAPAQAEALLDLVGVERSADPDRALARCEEAIRIAAEAGLTSWRMQALNWKGRLLRARNDCTGSLAAYRQARDLALADGDLKWAGDISYNIGTRYPVCGSREESAEALREAIEYGRRAGDAGLQAVGHRDLAVLARGSLDLASARRHLDLAWELLATSEDREARADVLYERASLARSEGSLGEARELFRRSLELNEGLAREVLVVDVLLSLGALSLDLRRPDEAREEFARARDRAQALGDLARAATAERELGAVEERYREPERAEGFFRRSLAIAERLGPGKERSRLTAAAKFRLGNVLLIQGSTDAAIPPLTEALGLQQETGDRRGEAMTRGALGTALARQGDVEAATAHLAAALAADRQLGDPIAIAWTLYRQAVVLVEEDPRRARAILEAAIATFEQVRSGLNVDPLRAAFSEGPRRPYELYVDLLIAGDEGRAAFAASERGRARALLDLLAEARVDLQAGVDPRLRREAREIEGRISWLGNELRGAIAGGLAAERVEALRTRLAEAEQDWWQVEAAIREHSARYRQLRAPSIVGVARLQASLPPGRALLEYWLGRERAYVFVVTRGSFAVVPLEPTRELLPLIEEFRSAILTLEPPRRLSIRAHRLYRALAEPALRAAGGAHELVVIPDGPLHLIPFEALVASASPSASRFEDLDYLASRAAISYAPSATVLASLGNDREAPGGAAAPDSAPRLVAFADPRHDAPLPIDCGPSGPGMAPGGADRTLRARSLGPLEGSRAEVRAIAQPYGTGARVFEGAAASEARVKRGHEVAAAELVHFAVHGVACEAFPERSGLVLSYDDDSTEDGFLQMREIFGLRLSADLVVLSACDSGTGKLVSGEGVIGLARAFFYAGTPSTVVSLWPVPDRSTAELMASFYAQLDAGEDKAVALQEARRGLIEGGGRHASPFYWAPFVLWGSREVSSGESNEIDAVGDR